MKRTQKTTANPARSASPARPEREQAMQKSAERRRKKRRRRLLGWLCALFVLAAGVAVALSLTVLFPVREVIAAGKSRYTADQIVAASGVRVNDNLFRAGRDAQERIRSALPYVGDVSVRRMLDGRLILTVQDTAPALCYRSDGAYLLVSEDGRLLETVDAAPKNLCCITLSGKAEGEPGQVLTLADPQEAALLDELTGLYRASGLQVTALDISDPLDITLTVEDTYLAKFGSKTDFLDKLEHLKGMLEKIETGRQGIINLQAWTSARPEAYFRDAQIHPATDAESSAPPAAS